jgi:hypothetical protein
MDPWALLLDGLAGALFAAAVLASVPTFEPNRKSWGPRFLYILVRYALPFASMPVAAAWLFFSR